MKRLELLKTAQTETTQEVSNAKMVNKEKRKFEKELSDLKFKLSDEKEAFEERMSSDAEIDFAAYKLARNKVKNVEQDIKDLEGFISEYYA